MKRLFVLLLNEFKTCSLLKGDLDLYPLAEKYSGLCIVVHRLEINGDITRLESDFLIDTIQLKLSKKFIRYSASEWHINGQGGYIWKPYAIKPRVKWLTKMIRMEHNIHY